MMNRAVVISAGFLLLSVTAILLTNRNAMVLTAFLLMLVFVKHLVIPIRKEFLWFALLSAGGAAVEIVLVNFGNAWTYANPQFFGIPGYMPVFWGLTGSVIISLYEGLADR